MKMSDFLITKDLLFVNNKTFSKHLSKNISLLNLFDINTNANEFWNFTQKVKAE